MERNSACFAHDSRISSLNRLYARRRLAFRPSAREQQKVFERRQKAVRSVHKASGICNHAQRPMGTKARGRYMCT
eukprot:1161047-Pelagomonas_calceolata.AAC.58